MERSEIRVFIVEDDLLQIEILKQILKQEGISNIWTFTSGEGAMEEIQLNPEIVFLDYQMGGYTGYDTLRKIKRYNPDVFVVMVTSQEDIIAAVETLKHGAFDYLQKNEKLGMNIKQVLSKIQEAKEIMDQEKPSILKKIFKYI